MPRGQRKEIEYTGKPKKIHDEIVTTEDKLKALRAELKVALKEQKKEMAEAAKKESKAAQAKLLKALKTSGKSVDEILEFLGAEDKKGEE